MDAARKDALEEARKSLKKHLKQTAKKQASAQMREVFLFSYMPALMVALMKDTAIDFLFGWIPGLGFVLSMCFSLLIFFLLMMAGSNQKYSLTKKGIAMIMTTLIEGVPFLSFLPFETICVFIIYLGDKKASERAARLWA